jgi:hypothetical protein
MSTYGISKHEWEMKQRALAFIERSRETKHERVAREAGDADELRRQSEAESEGA